MSMPINIISTYIQDRNLHVNTITGYPADMVLLKAVVYEKPWANGNKGYLTLMVMVPLMEYRECVPVTNNFPNTCGVFVRCIGSMTNIVPTTSRVNLNFYQRMIEGAGWHFKTTVPGVKGIEYESARQMAFRTIQKLKKGGDKKKAEKDEKMVSSQFFKNIMKGHLNDIQILANQGQDFSTSMEKLACLIEQINTINKSDIEELLDSMWQQMEDIMMGYCKEQKHCEECSSYKECCFIKMQKSIDQVKNMLDL